MKFFRNICLMLIIFTTNITNSYASTLKGISGTFETFEVFKFEGFENEIRIFSKDFDIFIELNNKDVNESKIIFIHNKEKYYISVSKKEIDSISTLKKLFFAKNQPKTYILEDENKEKKILNFNFNQFICKDQKIAGFFSKDLAEYLKKYINYDGFMKFLNETDFSVIPLVEDEYDLIKFFISQSISKGFIGEIKISNQDAYNLKSIKETNIEQGFNEKKLIESGFKKMNVQDFLS